ncbi:hypothetical protein A3K86_01775 [Photobacterium jeanii]|uniref:Uncharacterized protein n=2 Tax=Photobacterium jeanii TaxID=858640 RepID=A0A178KKM4_9GAMM|nr:hypothetical protein [Photobacterium jeanii]OAN17676.1 hypothetical protein A3K86_01775 [Photobacterium jeanii]PST92667.1 hypothetical protein C9I91_05710 [Photobacterium jeanii]
MSFSDYLDDYLKQRDQKSASAPKRGDYRQQHVVKDATSQSMAREALAKSQEEAFERSSLETKTAHYRINGRCVTEDEAKTLATMKVQAKPENPDRLALIAKLRKDLHLKKRS